MQPVLVTASVAALLLLATACSKSPATNAASSGSAHASTATAGPVRDCSKEIAATDLASILSAPVTKTNRSTDPETCEFDTTNGASVSLVVREGDEVEPNWKMATDPANVRLDPLTGVGDKALQMSDGSLIVAVKGKVFCTVHLIGLGSERTGADITTSRKEELARKLGSLCVKVFADRS